MMRWSGLGACWWTAVLLCVTALAGCAQRVITSEEPVSSAGSPAQAGEPGQLTETALPQTAAVTAAAMDIREIKLIEDNGQHGLFVKLSRMPDGVTHYVLKQPSRLVIEVAGAAGGGETSVQKYPVQDPVIHEIRVARHEGKIRLTLELRGDSVPAPSVDNLNDTVIAFLGEPTGGTQPVREQVVFARRAVERGPVETAAASQVEVPSVPPAPHAPRPTADRDSGAPGGGRPAEAQRGTGAVTRQPYHGQHVSLDFKDADVHNVLRLVAEVSKLNIVATDDVRGKVTLRLFDVPWDQALDIVLQVLNLESEQEGNVIRVSTVRRLREGREELQKAQEAARAVEPLHVDYIKVNYAKASKLAEIISGAARGASSGRQTTRSAEAEAGMLTTRGSVFVDEFSNTLVVRDIQRGVDNARELVRRLDVQTPQVLIEANIVEATTDVSRDLGVQWGYKYLAGPQTGNPTGVNFPGMIGLGGSGLGTGSGGVPFIADFPASAAVPGGGTALDLALGSLDGSQSLDIRLSALEKQGKGRVISRPRVVTLNNVAATIKSLTIIRVKLPSTGTIINTGAGGAAGGSSTATEKIETGIILIVTPQVSSDGFVMLDMFAKSSQADFSRTVDQIPTEISREANSHILIKDGQTVVLGGIYRDNVTDQNTGIPFLRDMPGLGWLFRTTSRGDRREDLLVFLTPRILGGPRQGLATAEEIWTHRQ